MLPKGVLFWQKCVEASWTYSLEIRKSLLKIAILALIKARGPFLWIRKKMGPKVDLEATR